MVGYLSDSLAFFQKDMRENDFTFYCSVPNFPVPTAVTVTVTKLHFSTNNILR